MHFLLVLVASVLVGWWQMPPTAAWSQAHMNDSIKQGLLVAAVIMEIDLVIIAVVDKLSGTAIEPTTNAPWWGAAAGGLAFFLGFGIIASAAGMIGGLLGGTLAYAIHHWRHPGGPAAPADMP